MIEDSSNTVPERLGDEPQPVVAEPQPEVVVEPQPVVSGGSQSESERLAPPQEPRPAPQLAAGRAASPPASKYTEMEKIRSKMRGLLRDAQN